MRGLLAPRRFVSSRYPLFITPARAFSKTHPRLKTARGLLATRHFVFSRNHIHHAGSRIFENSPPPTEVLLRRKSLRSLTALFDGFQCKPDIMHLRQSNSDRPSKSCTILDAVNERSDLRRSVAESHLCRRG